MGLLQWFREKFGGQAPDPEPAPAPPDMHWRPSGQVVEVACGAEGLLLWTSAPEQATCPECRRRGELRAISRLTNYR